MAARFPQPLILVVDDEEHVRHYMARVLQDDGYSVIEAENGVPFVSGAPRLPEIGGPLLKKPFLPADLSALAERLLNYSAGVLQN